MKYNDKDPKTQKQLTRDEVLRKLSKHENNKVAHANRAEFEADKAQLKSMLNASNLMQSVQKLQDDCQMLRKKMEDIDRQMALEFGKSLMEIVAVDHIDRPVPLPDEMPGIRVGKRRFSASAGS